MKKIFWLIITLCFSVLLFTGCEFGSNEETLVIPTEETPEVTKYTVTFDSNGGSTVESIEVENGKKITKPIDPTKEGYTFLGWFLGDEEWSFVGYVVTENMTLVAKWEEVIEPVVKTYTVTFNSNGGTSVTSITVEENNVINQPTNPTRSGYTFGGWYKESTFENAWIFANEVVTSNITLYAKWNKIEDPQGDHIVTFNTDGGSNVESQQVPHGYKVTKPADPTKEGHTFLGWYVGEDAWNFLGYPVTEDMTLTAKWSINSYKVTYVVEGKVEKTSYYYYDSVISTYETSIIRYGYEFIGWSLNDESNNILIDYKMPNQDIVLYAQWDELSSAGLIFDGNTVVGVGTCNSTVIEIPQGIIAIGNNAFSRYEKLVSIKLPTSLTSIGDAAFSYCTNLKSIEIPSSVVSIGDSAFNSCTNLTSIVIPDALTSIGDSVFNSCTSLTDIEIPSSVASIGEYAFAGCTKLKEVNIPNSVTNLGDYAFSTCSSLVTVGLSTQMVELPLNTFYKCTSLESVYFQGTINDWCNKLFDAYMGLYPNQELFDNIYIQDNVGTIIYYENKYSLLKNIETVALSENVIRISDSAFRNCTKLKSISIPNTVTSIGYSAFLGCGSLVNIDIPSSVNKICNYSFQNCSNLENIILPEGISYIAEYLFSGCSNLASVELPKSVKDIGQGAFNNCSKLTSVNLPSTLNIIRQSAFASCGSLETIYIPSSVYRVGYNTFSGCEKLSIHCEDKFVKFGTDLWDYNWNPDNRPVFVNGVKTELIESLLKNNDFDNKDGLYDGWDTYLADGGFAIFETEMIDGKYFGKISEHIISTTPYGIRLHNNENNYMNLVDGETYTISFMAKANMPKTIDCLVGQIVGGYPNFYDFAGQNFQIELTTELQLFTINFEADNSLGGDLSCSSIVFYMGTVNEDSTAATIWIGDIYAVKGDIVVDNIAPTITAESKILMAVNNEILDLDNFISVYDYVDGEIEPAIVIRNSNNEIVDSINCEVEGEYIVEITAVDKSGNISTKTISINIADLSMTEIIFGGVDSLLEQNKYKVDTMAYWYVSDAGWGCGPVTNSIVTKDEKTGNVIFINTQPTDANAWSIQTFQYIPEIIKTSTYVLKLNINSSVAGKMDFRITDHIGYNTPIKESHTIDLVVGENLVEIEFVLSANETNILNIIFGHQDYSSGASDNEIPLGDGKFIFSDFSLELKK